jgi:hypothetical protein
MNTERRISLALAAVFCMLACSQSTRLVLVAIAHAAFSLAFIWYGDELGAYQSGWRLNTATPGIMIRIMGWVLLCLTPLVVYTARLRIQWIPLH